MKDNCIPALGSGRLAGLLKEKREQQARRKT